MDVRRRSDKVFANLALISLATHCLYAFFRNNSEPYDYWRKDVDIAFANWLSVWGLCSPVILSSMNQEPQSARYSNHRRQLTKSSFLLISNLILSALVAGLLCSYSLSPVEFWQIRCLFVR